MQLWAGPAESGRGAKGAEEDRRQERLSARPARIACVDDANNGANVLDKAQSVKFTQPHQDGSVSLEGCVARRRSVREFRDQALTQSQLGQLLWAAQGVTGADAQRAVPSAGALYPLELYVAVGQVASLDHDDFGLNQSKIMNVIDSNKLERDAGGKPVPTFPHPAPVSGAYRYLPGRHELVLIAAGYQREKLVDAALGQDWIAMAPAVVCIAATFERTSVKYGRRGHGYVYIEAGHAAESLMLQAVALGLATTMVGAFNDNEVARLLHIGAGETPLCLIPIGVP